VSRTGEGETTATARARLYVARHGETEWNRVGRWQGATDVPLNDAGRSQALELAERLRGVTLAGIASSDLVRAAETASLVAHALGLPVLGTYAALRERSYGVFEGLTREECATRYAEIWTNHRPGDLLEPPGAEPRAEVEARMVRGLREVVEAHAGEAPVLVVSHGGAIRTFLAAVDGVLVPPMKNAECYLVRDRAGIFEGYARLGG
jgi:broad specificity phosphatase PhoE